VEVAQSIVSKLKSAEGVSFAAIAREALRVERYELATFVRRWFRFVIIPGIESFAFRQLLDYEPKASEQVPLLIQMNKFERALQKAIESGDSDLIHLVLILLKKNQPDVRTVFFLLLGPAPISDDLFIFYSNSCHSFGNTTRPGGTGRALCATRTSKSWCGCTAPRPVPSTCRSSSDSK